MVSKDTINTMQAGVILGVNPSRVRQLIDAGQLRAEKVGRDHLLDKTEVLELKKTRAKKSK